MECVQGKAIFSGVVIGKISVYGSSRQTVKRRHIEDVEHEIERYKEATKEAVAELSALYDKAVKEVGEMNAQLFEVHAMMLRDEDYNDSVENMIRTQKVNAEYAVACTRDNFATMFETMEDEYFKARSVDVKDISERVIAALMNVKATNDVEAPSIVVAAELTPSETIQMDKNMILAFVTKFGSGNSHTAILARSMGIPALTNVEISEEWDGKLGALDAINGKFYIEPDEATIKALRELEEEDNKNKELLKEMKGKETVTKDGRKIHLYANISKMSDVADVLVNDAEGVGLFRSEFLFLEREDYPTEQEQFQAYKYVAENLAGKKVIIRTLDVGADKKAEYFKLDIEENPAMGYRAIRICLERQDIFKTQLRAILRASAYGKISVMFPMIISVEEVLKAKEILAKAREELMEEGLECGEIEIGIMIETPAAVMVSDELARTVDFFSIGTNDLTQYTLAIDRQNQKLDAFYDAHHPAIIKMIDMVIKNAHAAGIWVGVCGELASDTDFVKTLVDMGIDELSVSPALILQLRKIIVNI